MNCKTWGQAPSQKLNWRPLQNDWAAYQFDAAVMYAGLMIDNASKERHKVGEEWQAKYSLSQLLEPDFRLPAVNSPESAVGYAPQANSGQNGLRVIAAANPDIVGRWREAPGKVA